MKLDDVTNASFLHLHSPWRVLISHPFKMIKRPFSGSNVGLSEFKCTLIDFKKHLIKNYWVTGPQFTVPDSFLVFAL